MMRELSDILPSSGVRPCLGSSLGEKSVLEQYIDGSHQSLVQTRAVQDGRARPKTYRFRTYLGDAPDGSLVVFEARTGSGSTEGLTRLSLCMPRASDSQALLVCEKSSGNWACLPSESELQRLQEDIERVACHSCGLPRSLSGTDSDGECAQMSNVLNGANFEQQPSSPSYWHVGNTKWSAPDDTPRGASTTAPASKQATLSPHNARTSNDDFSFADARDWLEKHACGQTIQQMYNEVMDNKQ